jgi:hypothetical protein
LTPQTLHPPGEWPASPYQQFHYPPSSQSLTRLGLHDISFELPDANSPANAELSDVRSPVNGEFPDKSSPNPVHGLQ